MEPDTMGPQPTTGEAGEEYRTSPDRALRDLKERIRREAPLGWADRTNDGGSDVRGEPVATEPQEALKTGTSSGGREATRRRSHEYERRDTIADKHRDDWRESLRDSYWKDRDRDRAPPRRVFDPQTGESHPLPYESKDRYIITHKASEPPTFRGYGITEYLEKWELHASRNRDRRDREPFARSRRLDDYPRNPRYEADWGRGDSRGRWETDQGRRDGYRDDRYERSDRDGYRDDKYERSDRDGYRDDRYERSDRDGYRDERYERSNRDGYRDDRYERSDRDGYRDDRYERSGRDGYRGGRYERGDRDWERRDGSRGRFEHEGNEREQRDESRGWYNRGDRRDETRGRYDSEDRRNDSRRQYEQGGSGGDRRNDSHGRNERGGYGVSSEPYPKSPDPKAARSSISRSADDIPSTLRNSCVYCRGEDHIKRDCPDLKRAIDEGLVVLDDRKYVKWANGLGDVSLFPSMKENVEARRVKPSKEKESVRNQSIKITFEGDMATTPIRVAATKSARGSTSKKNDTDYVMTEKDGQRIDGEEVILSPRNRGVKKFLMKSSLDKIDTVEPLRRALRQPMQCSILEYLAAWKPSRDELLIITRKTRIPLSEEGQGAPKAEAPTVAVTGVTARADRMATVLLDGMEGVPPDKFYILGSGAVETITDDGAILDVVIDNGSEAVIIDEDLAVQVGLGLDRSYLFEIETADGRKQQITGVCHKAAIEVQGVRVTLPIFAVKNCNSDLLLGRTWLSHVHAVTIERHDGSQTLSIRKPDGTRVMIETVEPRDPRNRATLAVGARPSKQIKSLPISGHAYPKEKDEEFGGVVSVSFLRARPPMGGYPSDTSE
ncbi:hypothetical protein CBR_g31181 [Chara braunii]|uniref:CCHC-type domain-containing protein n=1 Tax=Chara braunii TaxID=69332 RepID=A0A388JXS4_CHABU|nr:hypothetical protein CBR_g31181 [Chara braunii]|eukprot:GBG62542.1 hypothetical protein CBR_g31181 [Chara braunii]